MLPLPKGAVWQAFIVLCLALLVKDAHAEVRVVCYYTNWSVYRPGTAKFNPQNINPYLCTHLIYAFGGFTKDNTLKPFDKYQDIEQGGYAKFTGLKSYNKQLKTLLAIGGWNEASSRFSPLVASPERRQQFIRNILKFLRQNHFDGLDLDWEYPAFRDGGKPRDRDNYAQFVEELRSEFDRESQKTGRPRLLLTMAVPAGVEYIEKGYDIPKLNRYLDWFNILSYDYHSAFEPSVNHHAPLYSLEEPSEYNYDVELNIDYTVKFYLEAGAERHKLVLGIPTYGRSYTLINEESTEIGSPADGPGEQGDATREKGYLAYYEICQNIKEDSSWTVVQPNEKAMGPYAYRGNQWVGYDDEAIAAKKGQYVAENGLGGIMFWSIDNDDFRGTCTGKPYPLIESAKEALLEALGSGANEISAPSRSKKPARTRSRAGSSTNRNKVTDESTSSKSSSSSTKDNSTSNRKNNKKRPTTTKAPRTTSTTTEGSLYIGGRTTTPAPPTTPDPGADFKCEEEGFFAHPRDCKKYFWCLDSGPSNLGIVAHQFTCPAGLYFNTAADSCDFTRNVLCKKPNKDATTTKATPAATTTTTTTTTKPKPLRITAATSSYSYIQRTTTAKSVDDDEDEEEYEDEEPEPVHERSHEEDPKVIKELIELIKRVGGLDELEKQIHLQEDGTVVMKNPKTDQVSTTPSSISQSLYAKVLNRPNTLNTIRNRLGASKLAGRKEQTSSATDEEPSSRSNYKSINRNSRPSPQNAGIDKLPEFEGLLKEKPKYVTINRPRPTKSSDEQEEYDDETPEKESDAAIGEEDEDTSEATQRKTSSSYVNISRSRPTKSTLTEDDSAKPEEDEEIIKQSDSKSKYQSINRIRETATESADQNTPEDQANLLKPKSTYQTLTRTRTSTESAIGTEPEDTTTNTQIKSRLEYQSFNRNRTDTIITQEKNEVREEENETSKLEKSRPTYQSFTRNRNTTQTKTENEEETVESGKQTYQSSSRFRPTSASPTENETNDAEVKNTTVTRTRPTGFSSQQSNKSRGTTVPPAEVEAEAVVDEVQKKNRYSLFTRRQSINDENDAEVAPTQSSSIRARGTTVSSTRFVDEETNLKSVGSTNRYQIYDRRSTTVPEAAALGEVQPTSSTNEEGSLLSITVQSSESSLSHTTPSTPTQKQDTSSATPENIHIIQRPTETPSSPTDAELIASTQPPQNLSLELTTQNLQQPSVETPTHLSFPLESSSDSPNHPGTPTLKTGVDASSAPFNEPPLSSVPPTNDNIPTDSLTVVSTASDLGELDTQSTQGSKESLNLTIESGQNNTDQVTVTNTSDGIIEISGGKVVPSEGQVGDLELTKSNSKTESSLSNVNSKTRLSNNVDNSERVVTLTRTTSTTTQRPSSSPPASRSTSRFSSRRRPTTSTTTEQPDKFVSLLSSPRPFSLPSRRRTRPSQPRTTPSTDSSLDTNEVSSRTRPTAATKVSPLSSSSSTLNVSNVASKQFIRTSSFDQKLSFNRSPDLVESNSTLVDNTFNVGKVTSEAVIGVSANVNTFDRTSSTINSYVSPRIQQTQVKQGSSDLAQVQTKLGNSPGTSIRPGNSSWQTRSRGTFRPWRTTSSSTPSPSYVDRPYRPDYDTSVPSTNSPQNSQLFGLNGFGGQYRGIAPTTSPQHAATSGSTNKRERRPLSLTFTTPSASTRNYALTSNRYALDTTTSADNSHDQKIIVHNEDLGASFDQRKDTIKMENASRNEETLSSDGIVQPNAYVSLNSRISFQDDHGDEVTAGSISTPAFTQNNFRAIDLKASTSSDSLLNFANDKSSTKSSERNVKIQTFNSPKASSTAYSNINKYLQEQTTPSTGTSNKFQFRNRDTIQFSSTRSFQNLVNNGNQVVPTTQRAITGNRGHLKQATTTEAPHLTTEPLYRPHRPEYLSDLSSLLSVDLAKWSANHDENKLRKMVLRRRPMVKPSLDDESSQYDYEETGEDDNVGSFSSLSRTMVLENSKIDPLSLNRKGQGPLDDSTEIKQGFRAHHLEEEITYSKEAKDNKFRYVLREMKNRNEDGQSKKEKGLSKRTQAQLALPRRRNSATMSDSDSSTKNQKSHHKETRFKSSSEDRQVTYADNLRISNKNNNGETTEALHEGAKNSSALTVAASKSNSSIFEGKQTIAMPVKSDDTSVEHNSSHIHAEINALLEVQKEKQHLNDSVYIDVKSEKSNDPSQEYMRGPNSESVVVSVTYEKETLNNSDRISAGNNNVSYVIQNSAVQSQKALPELKGDESKEKNHIDKLITPEPNLAKNTYYLKGSSAFPDQSTLKRNYHVNIVYYSVEDPSEIDYDTIKAAQDQQHPSTLGTTLPTVKQVPESAKENSLHTIHNNYESSLAAENAFRKTNAFSNNLVEASSTAQRLSSQYESPDSQHSTFEYETQAESTQQTKLPLIHLTTSHVPYIPINFNQTAEAGQSPPSLIYVTHGSEISSGNTAAITRNGENTANRITNDQLSELKLRESNSLGKRKAIRDLEISQSIFGRDEDPKGSKRSAASQTSDNTSPYPNIPPDYVDDNYEAFISEDISEASLPINSFANLQQNIHDKSEGLHVALSDVSRNYINSKNVYSSKIAGNAPHPTKPSNPQPVTLPVQPHGHISSTVSSSLNSFDDKLPIYYRRHDKQFDLDTIQYQDSPIIFITPIKDSQRAVLRDTFTASTSSQIFRGGFTSSKPINTKNTFSTTPRTTPVDLPLRDVFNAHTLTTLPIVADVIGAKAPDKEIIMSLEMPLNEHTKSVHLLVDKTFPASQPPSEANNLHLKTNPITHSELHTDDENNRVSNTNIVGSNNRNLSFGPIQSVDSASSGASTTLVNTNNVILQPNRIPVTDVNSFKRNQRGEHLEIDNLVVDSTSLESTAVPNEDGQPLIVLHLPNGNDSPLRDQDQSLPNDTNFSNEIIGEEQNVSPLSRILPESTETIFNDSQSEETVLLSVDSGNSLLNSSDDFQVSKLSVTPTEHPTLAANIGQPLDLMANPTENPTSIASSENLSMSAEELQDSQLAPESSTSNVEESDESILGSQEPSSSEEVRNIIKGLLQLKDLVVERITSLAYDATTQPTSSELTSAELSSIEQNIQEQTSQAMESVKPEKAFASAFNDENNGLKGRVVKSTQSKEANPWNSTFQLVEGNAGLPHELETTTSFYIANDEDVGATSRPYEKETTYSDESATTASTQVQDTVDWREVYDGDSTTALPQQNTYAEQVTANEENMEQTTYKIQLEAKTDSSPLETTTQYQLPYSVESSTTTSAQSEIAVNLGNMEQSYSTITDGIGSSPEVTTTEYKQSQELESYSLRSVEAETTTNQPAFEESSIENATISPSNSFESSHERSSSPLEILSFEEIDTSEQTTPPANADRSASYDGEQMSSEDTSFMLDNANDGKPILPMIASNEQMVFTTTSNIGLIPDDIGEMSTLLPLIGDSSQETSTDPPAVQTVPTTADYLELQSQSRTLPLNEQESNERSTLANMQSSEQTFLETITDSNINEEFDILEVTTENVSNTIRPTEHFTNYSDDIKSEYQNVDDNQSYLLNDHETTTTANIPQDQNTMGTSSWLNEPLSTFVPFSDQKAMQNDTPKLSDINLIHTRDYSEESLSSGFAEITTSQTTTFNFPPETSIGTIPASSATTKPSRGRFKYNSKETFDRSSETEVEKPIYTRPRLTLEPPIKPGIKTYYRATTESIAPSNILPSALSTENPDFVGLLGQVSYQETTSADIWLQTLEGVTTTTSFPNTAIESGPETSTVGPDEDTTQLSRTFSSWTIDETTASWNGSDMLVLSNNTLSEEVNSTISIEAIENLKYPETAQTQPTKAAYTQATTAFPSNVEQTTQSTDDNESLNLDTSSWQPTINEEETTTVNTPLEETTLETPISGTNAQQIEINYEYDTTTQNLNKEKDGYGSQEMVSMNENEFSTVLPRQVEETLGVTDLPVYIDITIQPKLLLTESSNEFQREFVGSTLMAVNGEDYSQTTESALPTSMDTSTTTAESYLLTTDVPAEATTLSPETVRAEILENTTIQPEVTTISATETSSVTTLPENSTSGLDGNQSQPIVSVTIPYSPENDSRSEYKSTIEQATTTLASTQETDTEPYGIVRELTASTGTSTENYIHLSTDRTNPIELSTLASIVSDTTVLINESSIPTQTPPSILLTQETSSSIEIPPAKPTISSETTLADLEVLNYFERKYSQVSHISNQTRSKPIDETNREIVLSRANVIEQEVLSHVAPSLSSWQASTQTQPSEKVTTISFEEVSSTSTIPPISSKAHITMESPVSTISTTTHRYETELTTVPNTTTTMVFDTTTSPAATTSSSPTTTSPAATTSSSPTTISTTAATSSSTTTTTTTTSKPLETSESNNIEAQSFTQSTTEATTTSAPVKQRVVSPYNRLTTLSGRRGRPYTPRSRTRLIQNTSEKPVTSTVEETSESSKPTESSYRNRLSRYRGRSRTTTESSTLNTTPSTSVKTVNRRTRPTTDRPRYTATIRPRASLSTLFRQRANFRYRTSATSTPATTATTESPNYPKAFILEKSTTYRGKSASSREKLDEVVVKERPILEVKPASENVILRTDSDVPITSLSTELPNVPVILADTAIFNASLTSDFTAATDASVASKVSALDTSSTPEHSILPEATATSVSPTTPIVSNTPESSNLLESPKTVETKSLEQEQDNIPSSVSPTESTIATESLSTTSITPSPKTIIGRQRLILRRPIGNRNFQLPSSTTPVPEITTRRTYVRKRIFQKKVETTKLTAEKINEISRAPVTEPPPFVPSAPRSRLRILSRNNGVTLKPQVTTTEKVEPSPEPKEDVPVVTENEPKKDENKRNRSRRPGRRNRQRNKNRENKEQNTATLEESVSDNEADPKSNRKIGRANSKAKGDSTNRRQGRGRSKNRVKSATKPDSDNAITDLQEPLSVKNEKRTSSRKNIQSRNSGPRSKPPQTETILSSSETADEDFFRKDEQSSSEQNTNNRSGSNRFRSRENSNEEVPIPNSNASNEENENNAITKLRPVSKNEEKVFEKKPGLQRRKALRLRQKQNFRLLASKGEAIRKLIPHANPTVFSLDQIMQAGSSIQFDTSNLFETQTLPTYDTELNYVEQLPIEQNTSQNQDFFRDHLRNMTLDTVSSFFRHSSNTSTKLITYLTSSATTAEAYPSSTITTVPIPTTTESTAVLSSSNYGLDSLVSTEYFSHEDFVPQERLVASLDELPKGNIITTPNGKAEGTTEFGMRNVTGIFSSEGYVTRVQRTDVVVPDVGGIDSSIKGGKEPTDPRRIGGTIANTKHLRNNLSLRRNRVEASSKKGAERSSQTQFHDLDMSGSDSIEDIASPEGSTIRNTLIFLKGPTPNPNVLLAENSTTRTYQRSIYSKVQDKNLEDLVDEKDLPGAERNQKYYENKSSVPIGRVNTTANQEEEEESTEDYPEVQTHQAYEDEEDDYDFLSRILNSMKRIFSGEESDDALENTTKNYVTIKRMRVIPQTTPERDNETTIGNSSPELDTRPKSDSQETTTKNYVTIKRLKIDLATTGGNIETTTIPTSDIHNDSTESNEISDRLKSIAESDGDTSNSDEIEGISEKSPETDVETVTKKQKNYVSIVRPKITFSSDDDSLSDNVPDDITPDVNQLKNDSSLQPSTAEIFDTTDMPESIATYSYITIKRMQSSTTIPIDQIEEDASTVHNKKFQDDEVITTTSKYITLTRTRTPKVLSAEIEDNIEISTPGEEFSSTGLVNSTPSSIIDHSTTTSNEQEDRIILPISATNTNTKDTNDIKNIFSPRRVYAVANREKPSPITGTVEPFDKSEEELPEINESSPGIDDIVDKSKNPLTSPRTVSFRARLQPYATATSTENSIVEFDEPSRLSSTSTTTFRPAFSFQSRSYSRSTRPTPSSEDDKSNDSENGEDEARHPFGTQNRSIEKTTQEPIVSNRLQGSTRRTFAVRRRVRVSSTTIKNGVSSDEPTVETTTKPTIRRNYASLKRPRVPTTEATLNSADDFQLDSIASTTRRTFGLPNRRPPLVKTATSKSPDYHPSEDIDQPTGSTTKRTYGLLNRQKFPNRPKLSDDVKESQDIVSSTKRTYVIGRGGQIDLPSDQIFPQEETSSTTKIQSFLSSSISENANTFEENTESSLRKFKFPTRARPVLGPRYTPSPQQISGETGSINLSSEQPTIISMIQSQLGEDSDENSEEEEATNDKQISSPAPVPENNLRPSGTASANLTEHPLFNLDFPTPTPATTSDTQTIDITTNTNNLTYFRVNGPDGNTLVSKQLVGVAYIDDNYGSNNTQPVVDVNVAERNVNVDFSRPLLLNLNRRFQNFTSRRGAPSQVNSATRSTSRYSSTAASPSTESPNDTRNRASGAASGRRRVAVFRVRRPQSEANVDNNSGSVRRRPTGEQRDNSRDTDVTTTQQTLTVTTGDSPSARRSTVRRKLVRKRPVSSATTPQPLSSEQPSDGQARDQEPRRTYSPTTRTRKTTTTLRTTEVTEEIVQSSTIAPVNSTPTKRFRKVIRRLKKPVLNETTTIIPVLKAVPQDDGRIHLQKVGEHVQNETLEADIISKVISDVKESVRSFGLTKHTNYTQETGEMAVENTTDIVKPIPNQQVLNLDLIELGTSTTDFPSIDARISSTTESIAYEEVQSKINTSDASPENTPGSQDKTTVASAYLNDTQIHNVTDVIVPADFLEAFENTTDTPGSIDSTDLVFNGTTPATDTTSTIATTKSKLYASRRPYKPTKPSILAITSTESSSSTPKSYVRKYSTNFTSIKPPGEIENPVAIIVPKAPAAPKQTTSKYRPKQATSKVTPPNGEDVEYEDEGEEGDEEDDDENGPEGPRKIPLIKPNYVLINRTPKVETHLRENPEQDLEDSDEENEPHNEEEKIRQLSKPVVNYPRPAIPLLSTQSNSPILSLGIPSPPIINQPTNPIDLLQMVLLPTQQPTLSLNAAPESGAVVRLNNGFVGVLQKSESKEVDEEAEVETTTQSTTTRRKPTHRITRPTNKPRVVNRPFVTTIHPASLQLVSTPIKPTTPAPFRPNGTRNYERKYSAPSSTESTNPDNSLLEDLNIDALNARNKKIFEQTSRKHTTMKPKTTQKELNATSNTNDTDSASYYTTQLQDTELTSGLVDANGFTHFQEGNTASPAPHTSTTSKITTLHHIFELSKEDDTTTERFNPHDHVHTVMTSDPKKLVEINRIVEVYSRENVFKINVNSHATRNVSSSELKLETLPRVDHIGEISRNSLVNLFDSVYAKQDGGRGRSLSTQGGDIVIEGRSAVSGLTSPEGVGTTEFTPVRNSIPQYQTGRDGKSDRQQFVPDVLSGVETSTISLEGLFQNSRKSKSGRVVNSPVYATSLGEVSRTFNTGGQATVSPVLATTASFKPANGVIIESFSTVRSTTPVPVTNTLTPTSEPEISTPSTTVEAKNDLSSTRNPNYIRPLVPILRPESNEAAPLVISIANLDQVTLSKVPRDSRAATSGRVSTFVRPDGTNTFTTGEGFTNLDSESTLQEHYKTNEPIVHTQTSYSSEIHIVKKRVPRKHSKRGAQRAQSRVGA